MTNFLFAKNKTDFVDGTLKKLETSSSEYKSWMRRRSPLHVKKAAAFRPTAPVSVGYPDWWPGKKDDKAKPKAAYVETGTSLTPGLNEGQYQEFVKFFSRSSNKVEAKPEANMA
nr:Gag-pre-integrase domain, Gag-polypeptide of LTR copia-type [Tanacetum cinerariifolium]